MRIFLDANILFSAAKTDGAVRHLLSLLVHGRHELWADGYVVEEARRNLGLKSPESIAALEALLKIVSLGPVAAPRGAGAALQLPEKDRPVLEAAIRHMCDILVTGDRTHFGRLYGSVVEGVEILAPAALAEKLTR